MVKYFTFFLFFVLAFTSSNLDINAQNSDSTESWFSITGSATATMDLYDFTSDPSGSQAGRRPASLSRLLFSPVLKFGSFSLPLQLMLTSPETNVTTPIISNPTLSQFFQSPANMLGISSLSQNLGWANFSLGAHTPQFSELSGGDQQIFGGGIDLKPGDFRIAASAGIVQRGVASDLTNGIRGAYQKDMYMAKIGYGKEDSSNVALNLVYSKDNRSSIANNIISILPSRTIDGDSVTIIPADTVRLRAEEGMIASINSKIIITEGIDFKLEGAVSNFTRDMSSPLQDVEGNPFTAFMSSRSSTRTDIAGTTEIGIRMANWGVRLTGLYMGAGFVPIGNPFQQSDRIDVKVSPYLRLFNGDLSINGSIGNRINNLSETKGETLNQLIASANIAANITEEFSINGSYSNFGVRNNNRNDTLRIENVASAFSIDPSYTIVGESLVHVINAGFSKDQFEDFNVFTGALSSNNTTTYLGSYMVSIKEMGLTIGTSGSYMENALPTGAVIIRSIGLNASMSLLERTLFPTASFSVGSSSLGGTTDSQSFIKAGLRWVAAKWITFGANYGNNNFEYGNIVPRGRSFSERFFQFSATSNF